jgi:hypothetical protein
LTTEAERLAAVERDLRDHARIITEMTTSFAETRRLVSELDKREALRSAEEKHVDERFDRIEVKVDGIYRLGWWILAAFGSSALALILNFAFKGGFSIG